MTCIICWIPLLKNDIKPKSEIQGINGAKCENSNTQNDHLTIKAYTKEEDGSGIPMVI
jgi:hypothetical protein